MLATPCATSSQFERCRRPVMPSATTADSSDSMAPSRVKEIAVGRTAWIGLGRKRRQARQPEASTGCRRTACRSSATGRCEKRRRRGGKRDRDQHPRPVRAQRRRPRMTTMVQPRRQTAAGVSARPRAQRAGQLLEQRRPARARSVRPSSSLTWLAKMITAMPAVKPTVTGIGDELDEGAEPEEADGGQHQRPTGRWRGSARPCRAGATVAATRTMNAPAGPPIWNRLPPSSETRKPPKMAV